MTVADLRHLTGTGRPVVCPIQLGPAGGHWVVVAGVAYNAVYFHCPAGGPARRSRAGWAAGWHDFTRDGRHLVGFGVCGWPG